MVRPRACASAQRCMLNEEDSGGHAQKMKQGEYVLHEKAAWYKSPHFSLIVPVADDEFQFEQLVTEQLTESRFRLLCIPFFLYGVSLGDTVEGDLSVERPLRVFTVVERSGRSTYRIRFPQEPISKHLQHIRDSLLDVEKRGGLFERYYNGYWSIDAEDERVAREIEEFLASGEQAGKWQYEVGHRSWEVVQPGPRSYVDPEHRSEGLLGDGRGTYPPRLSVGLFRHLTRCRDLGPPWGLELCTGLAQGLVPRADSKPAPTFLNLKSPKSEIPSLLDTTRAA
mgnify:CR=1 FL=1